MKIKKGYKIIIALEEQFLDEIDLEGYDLDKSAARVTLIEDIKTEVEQDMKIREVTE